MFRSGTVWMKVGRVLLPPSKAVALVEFLVATDARRAFKRLAYTRFQHVPLYLEWAPMKVGYSLGVVALWCCRISRRGREANRSTS